MRGIVLFCVVTLLLAALVVPTYAATEASSVSSFATVYPDGSCQISMTVTLEMDQEVDSLHFPIPREASAVALNGSRVSAVQSGDVRRIDISKLFRNGVRSATFTVQYSIHDVIVNGEGGTLQMQVPLLSGFAYPVQYMSFSVTLPGATETLPGFQSGYHQNRIEEDIYYEVDGPVITGNTVRALKDHETLTMTMVVSEAMFPRSIANSVDYQWAVIGMLVCGAAALLYWLLTMFNRPGFARRQPEQPQGYHAGNLGCALTGKGLDLTMMVLQWAQLGYVLIHVKGNKVLLHKRMEMGNERSDTELRWFKKLFAKGNRVNTAEYRYGNLCRLAAKKADRLKERMKRWNGNPKLFRGLTAGVGLFAGAGIAVALADGAALQGVLMVLLGAIGAVSGWFMQLIGHGLLLRDGRMLKISLLNGGVWLLLSVLAGSPETGLLFLALVLLLGILWAWGGRRTPAGRLAQMQTLGFARYLTGADKADLQRLSRNDPDYFFRMAPGALALGREKAFASRFGDQRLEGCPYLTSGMDGHMTPLQWSAFMRRTVNLMNRRADRMSMEKLMRFLAAIKKG